MTHAAPLLAMLIAESALGFPRHWPHPVMAAGALIAWAEGAWNRGGGVRRHAAGVALLALLVVMSVLLGLGLEYVAGRGWGLLLVVAVGTTGLAQRSLHDHVAAVLRPLAAGDFARARSTVAMIVGRDTEALDEAGVATAATESLAESFCDGVVAPAFWFLLAGLPGLFAAKAINTADSIVGHRTPELRRFGWASARADDLINWMPARIAGALVCLAGRGGWAVRSAMTASPRFARCWARACRPTHTTSPARSGSIASRACCCGLWSGRSHGRGDDPGNRLRRRQVGSGRGPVPRLCQPRPCRPPVQAAEHEQQRRGDERRR